MNRTNWQDEFEEKFFIKNGEMSVETYLDVKDFISDLLNDINNKIKKSGWSDELTHAESVVKRTDYIKKSDITKLLDQVLEETCQF